MFHEEYLRWMRNWRARYRRSFGTIDSQCSYACKDMKQAFPDTPDLKGSI